MTFSYRPDSTWTSKHQMQINGKRNNLTVEDLRTYGRNNGISDKRIKEVIVTAIGVARN